MLFDAMPRSEEGENFQLFGGRVGIHLVGCCFIFFPPATFKNKKGGGGAFCCFFVLFCLFPPLLL